MSDDDHMTQVPGAPSRQVIEKYRGMAHFPDTGPFGTTCGTCQHKGYARPYERWNKKMRVWEIVSRRVQGCAMFHKLTGHHGPDVKSDFPSCKYYEAFQVLPGGKT